MATFLLGTIDGGGNGEQILMARLNAVLRQSNPNHVDLTLEDFAFGLPERVEVPTPTHNTRILCGAKLDSGYYGVRECFYTRIHPNEFGPIQLTYEGETRIVQLATRLSNKLGVVIEESDLIDGPISPPGGGNQQITVDLQFHPDSIIYYSGVEIQMGTNDPTGEGVQQPYENAMTFAFDQRRPVSPDGETDRNFVSAPFSLGMGRDNSTKRIAALSNAMQGAGASAFARIRYTEALSNLVPIGRLPFAGYWTDPSTGTPRAISVFGDVYRLDEEATVWTLVGSWFGIGANDITKVQQALTTPRVKFAVQGDDGTVYILARNEADTPGIWAVNPETGNRTKLAITVGRLKSLSAADWGTAKIEDVLFSNNRIWMLVSADTLYDVHATKGRRTPAVEMITTNTLTTNYHPLAEINARYSGIEFNPTSVESAVKWKLVTPPTGSSHCDAVALLPTKTNNHLMAVMYRYQAASEYLAYILPNTRIPVTTGQRFDLDIAGYQVPLNTTVARLGGNNVAGHYLDVVQILAPVEVEDFNRYFLASNLRTKNKFLGYGLMSLVSVGTRQGNSAWEETRIAMEADYRPRLVTLFDKGNRQHVVFQNGAAIHKPMFTQVAGTSRFEVTLDSSASLENHTGFSDVAPIGACKWIKPIVAELPAPVVELTAPTDTEAGMSAIDFSFVGVSTANAPAWLTASAGATTLTRRVPSANYGFMGAVPAATMAEGNNLYFWPRNGYGVYRSTNKGASWSEFNSVPYLYRQERPKNAQMNLLGAALLNIAPSDFKKASITGDTILAEIKTVQSLNVYDINAGFISAPYSAPDNMVYTVKSGASNPNTYQPGAVLDGYGLNLTSSFSPRQVIAWDVDPSGGLEVIGRYTTALNQPYGTAKNIENYMFNIPGTLIDFNRDVKYLGVRHAIITQEGNVYTLHFAQGVAPVKTIGLAGTVGSAYNFLTPEAAFHIWDAIDNQISYMPFVVYGNKRLILMERLDENNDFAVSVHNLAIPGDNSTALTLVPMFTANRKEYWFAQRGNGVFKLAYSFNPTTSVSTVSLVRVFNLDVAGLRDINILNGCAVGIAAQNAPQELPGRDVLPLDYPMGHWCTGTTKTSRFADGEGHWRDVVETNHIDCGGSVASNVTAGGGVVEGS